jgi:hypothetical protein
MEITNCQNCQCMCEHVANLQVHKLYIVCRWGTRKILQWILLSLIFLWFDCYKKSQLLQPSIWLLILVAWIDSSHEKCTTD